MRQLFRDSIMVRLHAAALDQFEDEGGVHVESPLPGSPVARCNSPRTHIIPIDENRPSAAKSSGKSRGRSKRR